MRRVLIFPVVFPRETAAIRQFPSPAKPEFCGAKNAPARQVIRQVMRGFPKTSVLEKLIMAELFEFLIGFMRELLWNFYWTGFLR
jgi:hypothetical protein